uniref:Uncharacterized protein n=1 Tax=viral metagenome TaxID=1070528 RepID=A0A6C0DVM3_9ZZZZ
MFRRLAEAFQDSGNSGSNDGSHGQYINSQNKYFNSLPNMILSGTSGLKGFDTATQSVDTMGQGYQQPVVKNPNNIFIQDSSPDLNKMAKQCSASSLDQLIAMKNPNAAIGCGWLYTPPNQGSPYPVVSQGFIGNSAAPLQNYNPPDYKKYFFDLQLAKKQMLLDKCKALKACSDVDSDVFNGTCGYCGDTNQGVPIDTVGQPLYGGDPLGSCSPQSIVISSINCPPPPGSGPGPQPVIDKTCQSINGRLSATCLYDKLLTAGCSDNGSLAIALSGSPDPSDYISNIRNGDAVKIYNRVANPPLNLDVFSQGATTVDVVLQEARQLSGNTKLPSNTATGAAARDLCLQKGAINGYNFCLDLPDTTPPPFDMGCLQQIFRKMGGQPTGTAYPNTNTMPTYNSMGTLSAVKQYINTLIQGMNSTDYTTQRTAMIQFLGISPERLITRAPYQQGVEVIWMLARPGYPNQVSAILKRTIETDIVQFTPGSTGIIPQLASTAPGLSQFVSMIQLFDVRAPSDFTTKFSITIDDGFFVAVNQPPNIATSAFNTLYVDQTGLFANLSIQGPTNYISGSCSNYFAATPNITKLYYSDAGGGGHTFQMTTTACSGSSSFTPPYYSLTLEPRAPFLNFEVLQDGGTFDDTRNPGMFNNLISQGSLEFHNRPEERNSVPGNKGFIRLTNNSSILNLTNIAYQAWGTCTFAFRIQSMPIKDSLFTFWVFNKLCAFYLVPLNGSTAQIRVQTNMTPDNTMYDGPTNFNIQLGTWYYMEVAQRSDGFDVFCDSINNIIKNGNYTTQNTKITNSGPITTTNNYGLSAPGQYSCNVAIGGKAGGLNFANSSFQFDLAWMHFFDYYISTADVIKDCKTSWQFTQFPDSLNTYKTSG